MNTTEITLKWVQDDQRDQGKEDPSWYTTSGTGHDPVVLVTKGNRTIQVATNGIMRVVVYDKVQSKYETVGFIQTADDWAKFGIHNDEQIFQSNESGRTDWANNSWFDLYAQPEGLIPNNNHLDSVCHTLTEAIDQAVALLGEDQVWGEWESL